MVGKTTKDIMEDETKLTAVERELNDLNFSLNNLEAAYRDLSYLISPLMLPDDSTNSVGHVEDGPVPSDAPMVALIKSFQSRVDYLRYETNNTISRLSYT